MSKGKGKSKPRRRRSRSVSGLRNMQLAAAAVGVWGPELLARLPYGFETVEASKDKEGRLKSWWKNKRVLIVLALLVYCVQSEKLSTRLWAIPLAALFGLAVQQHRITYGEDEKDTLALTEKREE